MDRAVKHYSSLFTLPSYKKLLVLLALTCVSGGLVYAVIRFPSFEGLFTGLFLGFSRLMKHGLIQKLPDLVGVQASGCAPLYSCWMDKVFERGETIAEGIRIAFPSRGEQILQAIRATEGKILEVTDAEIVSAWEKMKRRGFYIEPTSAVPIAALAKMNRDELGGKIVVIPLTGHGLKVTLPVTGAEIG